MTQQELDKIWECMKEDRDRYKTFYNTIRSRGGVWTTRSTLEDSQKEEVKEFEQGMAELDVLCLRDPRHKDTESEVIFILFKKGS